MAEYLIETDEQICHELKIDGTIIHREDGYSFQVLPGCPRIALDDPDIGDFLCKELQTTELDEFEPYMWLKAKQDSKHISSLTEQIVRGRNIIITEKPRLYLVWAYNRLFIKPLPIYLLSRPLCDHFLLSHNPYISPSVQEDLRRAASGLIRSYFFLIQHESDFIIAQYERTRLIPEEISYVDFARFTQLFNDRLDRNAVSRRFHFEELRLTRLNIWSKIFYLRNNYAKIECQYSAYIALFYAPILFIFGVFSVALGAMQVILAADNSDYKPYVAYRGFSLFTLYFILVIMVVFFIIIARLVFRELIFALKDLLWKKEKKGKNEQM